MSHKRGRERRTAPNRLGPPTLAISPNGSLPDAACNACSDAANRARFGTSSLAGLVNAVGGWPLPPSGGTRLGCAHARRARRSDCAQRDNRNDCSFDSRAFRGNRMARMAAPPSQRTDRHAARRCGLLNDLGYLARPIYLGGYSAPRWRSARMDGCSRTGRHFRLGFGNRMAVAPDEEHMDCSGRPWRTERLGTIRIQVHVWPWTAKRYHRARVWRLSLDRGWRDSGSSRELNGLASSPASLLFSGGGVHSWFMFLPLLSKTPAVGNPENEITSGARVAS